MRHIPIVTLIFILGAQGCSSDDIQYEISSAGLKINTKIHSRYIPVDSLIRESIKIIDLDSEMSYQPHLRLWGVSQIEINTRIVQTDDYHEGWFLLNNDEIALVFLSEHNRAVFIRTKLPPPRQVQITSKINPAENSENKKYYSVILGTQNPERVIELMNSEWRQTETY